MKGDTKVLKHLNAQLKNELTAINPCFLHYRMLKSWGCTRLAKHQYDATMGEMKHTDKPMDRILMIERLPNLRDLGKLTTGETAVEILSCDLKAELASVTTLKDGIAHCESVRDHVSRALLEDILDAPRNTSTGWKRRSSGSRRWVNRTGGKRRDGSFPLSHLWESNPVRRQALFGVTA